VIASGVVFDVLVRRQYSLHRSEWVADGKPIGFFFVPQETTVVAGLFVSSTSTLARRRISFGWLFHTPEWIHQDRIAKRLLLSLRALVIGWYVALVAVFAYAFAR
jgi:hypothetical protein